MGSEQSSSRRQPSAPQQPAPVTEQEYCELVRAHAELREHYERTLAEERARLISQGRITVSTTETVRTETVRTNVPQTGINQTSHTQTNPIRVQNVPSGPTPTQNQANTLNLERNRTPYNYSSAQLQNATQQRPNIYPNLNNEIPVPIQRNTPVEGNRMPSGNSQVNSVFVTTNRSNETNRVAPATERSQSSNGRNRLGNQNQNNLSCITCRKTFSLRIYQCHNGHSSCGDCHAKRALCGQCRMIISDIRNIMLEDFISQQKIPCPNADDGCCLVMKILEMETHVKECPFREILCPTNGICGNCNWRGKIKQLEEHFTNNHPGQVHGEVDTEMFLTNLNASNHTLYLVTMGPYNFLFHAKVCEMQRKIFMAVQLLGTRVSASKWTYEIHLFNKRESRRKYQLTDICTSATISTNDLFKQFSCAVLPLPYAKTFVNEGTLSYKFFIKQKQEDRADCNINRRGRGAHRRR